ncbi:Rho GTPase-activating protein 20 [Pelomyxa schiedti]|nr:Rho GTPase-activating protein 20 [Pelomyxa schiedti]
MSHHTHHQAHSAAAVDNAALEAAVAVLDIASGGGGGGGSGKGRPFRSGLFDSASTIMVHNTASVAAGPDDATREVFVSGPGGCGAQLMGGFGPCSHFVLQVTTISGHDLVPRDRNGKSDPYVTLKMDSEQFGQSHVISRTLNPTWNESFFAYYLPCSKRNLLVVEVWDHDLGASDYMGKAVIRVTGLVPGVPHIKDFTLYPGNSPDIVSGTIKLSITAHPCVAGPVEYKTGKVWKQFFSVTCSQSHALFQEEPHVLVPPAKIIPFTPNTVLIPDKPELTAFTISGEGIDHAFRPVNFGLWESATRLYVKVADECQFFGLSLEKLMELQKQKGINHPIPIFVTEMLNVLLKRGVTTEFILRESVTNNELSLAKQSLTIGKPISVDSPHVIANLLKHWVRKLPEPLLTYALYEEFLAVVDDSDHSAVFNKLKSVLGSLPRINFDILMGLLGLFHEVAKHHTENHMTAANVSIVFSPNIMVHKDRSPPRSAKDIVAITTLGEVLILNFPVLAKLHGETPNHSTSLATEIAELAARSTAAAVAEYSVNAVSSTLSHPVTTPSTGKAASTSPGRSPLKNMQFTPPPPTHYVTTNLLVSPTMRFGASRKVLTLPPVHSVDSTSVSSPSESVARATQLFNFYDADHNQTLDIDEFSQFVQGMLARMGTKISHTEVVQAVQLVQGDRITLTEFINWFEQVSAVIDRPPSPPPHES